MMTTEEKAAAWDRLKQSLNGIIIDSEADARDRNFATAVLYLVESLEE